MKRRAFLRRVGTALLAAPALLAITKTSAEAGTPATHPPVKKPDEPAVPAAVGPSPAAQEIGNKTIKIPELGGPQRFIMLDDANDRIDFQFQYPHSTGGAIEFGNTYTSADTAGTFADTPCAFETVAQSATETASRAAEFNASLEAFKNKLSEGYKKQICDMLMMKGPVA